MIGFMGYPFLVLVAVVLVAILFWPKGGLVWRWRREEKARFRIQVEDALKHLYYCERETQQPTLLSIAGRLQISENRAAELMQVMQSHGLVQMLGEQLQLTDDGRAYALHIVRAHRLWERYLADETGYTATRWHAKADQIEHKLSPDEIDDLAGRLGHPLTDPHGDPIPTKHGEFASQPGQPLTTLLPGQAGRITHLEDEPQVVYAQLVADGFYPGMVLKVLGQSQHRVQVWAAGNRHLLAPIVAAAISVEPIEQPVVAAAIESLADLKPRESGRVSEISPRCHGVERRRLLDLGIVPGTQIAAELISPSGDPTAYRIRGALIALRREQAAHIKIERLPVEVMRGHDRGNGRANQ